MLGEAPAKALQLRAGGQLVNWQRTCRSTVKIVICKHSTLRGLKYGGRSKWMDTPR